MRVIIRLYTECYSIGGRSVPIGKITVIEPSDEFIATCDQIEFHKLYVAPTFGTSIKRDSLSISREIYLNTSWVDRPFTLDTKLFLFKFLMDQKDEESILRFIAGFEWNRLWTKDYREFAILFCERMPSDMAKTVYRNLLDPEVKLLYKLYWGFE